MLRRAETCALLAKFRVKKSLAAASNLLVPTIYHPVSRPARYFYERKTLLFYYWGVISLLLARRAEHGEADMFNSATAPVLEMIAFYSLVAGAERGDFDRGE